MKLPIGKSDFKAVIDEGFVFVDKTLFIRDIINEDSEVTLITRPRRFGKTINLSMLHYFFSNQNSAANARLFTGLKIEQETALFAAHQGKHPVIYISLKDVHENNFKNTYDGICEAIQSLYYRYDLVLVGNKLNESEKTSYKMIMDNVASYKKTANSLRFLSDCLYKYYEQKVIILIDEYDAPILASYDNDFSEVISFMRSFYGAALKDNPYLFKGVMTGILRVAKENIFSGLNNLKVFTLLNSKYGDYFGFTEPEVNDLLAQANLANSAAAIKDWYNGYNCGAITIYNPWSIISCLSEQGMLQPYWVNTSNNELIEKVLSNANSTVKQQFEQLLLNSNTSIAKTINDTLSLTKVMQDEQALWSLLVFSGYLKVISSQRKGLDVYCQLSIPNQEVQLLYQKIFKDLLVADIGEQRYQSILAALIAGRVDDFCSGLKNLLEQVVSSHDTSQHDSEKFYHGLVLGLAYELQEDYRLASNKESGYGRFDLMLIPKDKAKKGIILEFKKLAAKHLSAEAIATQLRTLAEQGLTQIQTQQYQALLKQHEVKSAILLSLSFAGKAFAAAHSEIKL